MSVSLAHTASPPRGAARARSPFPPELAPLALARAFVDVLRREAGEGALGGTTVRKADDDDLLQDFIDEPDGPEETTLRADQVGAAVLLGSMLAPEPELLRKLRRGAPVLGIEVPNAAAVDVVSQCVHSCALGSKTEIPRLDRYAGYRPIGSTRRQALLIESVGPTEKAATASNDSVNSAFRLRMPVVGIASDVRRHLPRDFGRACERTLILPQFDPDGIALVAEALTGAAPTRRLEAGIAKLADLSDLTLARARADSADEMTDLLEDLIRKRASMEGGARLEELEGYGEAKAWGLDVAADLKAYKEGRILWADVDRGVLLSGPPGTGKTTFAKALARTAGLPFLAGSLGQWQSAGEGHLGTTLGAMRAFFDEARRQAPVIALVDELDSFGDRSEFKRDRSYSTQVVNAFLECVDGAVDRTGVVLVGATNHVDRIDPAIRRAGRLDRHIAIPLPDVAALAHILRHHLGPDAPPAADLSVHAAAALGSTGADCAAWVRRAKAAARRAGRPVSADDLLAEIERGRRLPPPALFRRMCVHEAGHVVAGLELGFDVTAATVGDLGTFAGGKSRGGLTEFANVEAEDSTMDRLRDQFVVGLAGRAAEIVLLGTASLGSETDIASVTRAAAAAVGRCGLGGRLASLGDEERIGVLLGITPLGDEVEKILRDAEKRAAELVRRRRADVERVADALAEHRHLDGPQLRATAEAGAVRTGAETGRSARAARTRSGHGAEGAGS